MAYITHDFLCEQCNIRWDELVDRNDIPSHLPCPNCNSQALRVPSGSILKGEIEEKVHGGKLTNGKLYRQYTGFKEVAEQRAAEVRLKKAHKNKNFEEAADAAKELHRLRDKTKKGTSK